jgi:hypothetical protein
MKLMSTIIHRGPVLLLLGAVTVAIVVGGALVVLYDNSTPPVSTRPVASPTAVAASPIPHDDEVVSIRPEQAGVGDLVELRIDRTPGSYGLHWVIERSRDSSWEFFGHLVVGPGEAWENEKFYLPPNLRGGYADIGFNNPASMELEIPELEAGRYRLVQNFLRQGTGSIEKRTETHAAEFEVVE